MKKKIGPVSADKPTATDGKQYHLQTGSGDIAPRCLLVGDPGRAEMIANSLFGSARKVGDHRGLKSFTGYRNGERISVVTTGMGGPSVAITLPEAVLSGGRVFIRVGSCGALWENTKPGDSAICTGAVRFDGASENWAPLAYPAIADYRVVAACVEAAKELVLPYHVGIGATTSDFYEGQARQDINGHVPPWLKARHEELIRQRVLFYSMEEATLFVWCSTHGDYLAGAVDAIYANRITNEFAVKGEEEAAQIAIRALLKIRI